MLKDRGNHPHHAWSLPPRYKPHFSLRILCYHMNTSSKSTHRRCSVKNRCSEKFHKFHRKTTVLDSIFNRKRLQRRCFGKICENSKNIYCEEDLRTNTPEWPRKISPLLVSGTSMLDSRWCNGVTNTLDCKLWTSWS